MSIVFESGHPDIRNSLAVHFESERLTYSSPYQVDENISTYCMLFFDELTAHAFFVPTQTQVQKIVRNWEERWNLGNPISAIEAYDKQTDAFVGFVECNGNRRIGHVEISYVVSPNERRKGYATEMVGSIVKNYLPELQKRKTPVGGYSLTHALAVVETANHASRKVLQKNQFKVGEEEEYFVRQVGCSY